MTLKGTLWALRRDRHSQSLSRGEAREKINAFPATLASVRPALVTEVRNRKVGEVQLPQAVLRGLLREPRTEGEVVSQDLTLTTNSLH